MNADTGYTNMRAIWSRRVNGRDAHIADLEYRLAKAEVERDALQKDAATVAHLRSVREHIAAGKGAGAHFSDAEVALQVRMLTRDQLVHEMICVMARDRIIALSDANAVLKAERDALRQQRDEARERAHEVYGIESVLVWLLSPERTAELAAGQTEGVKNAD